MNFHLRPSSKKGRFPGKLFIRIIHARQCRHIPRDYSIYTDEWDAEKKQIILPPTAGHDACLQSSNSRNNPAKPDRFRLLASIDESMKNDLSRLREIVSQLSGCGDYTVSDIVERFVNSLDRNTVRGYGAIAAGRLREQGRERTARAYLSAVRSFIDFNDGKDLMLSRITAPLIAEYEQHLFGKGLKPNTVSFYLRNLRAIYFRAAGERIIPRQSDNPFLGMHTGVYETRRRALDDRQIRALAKLDDVLHDDGQSRLRDSLMYFMFCYHARGMSFVDMAHLTRESIDGETLTYRRRKTGGSLEIKITGPMRRILTYFSRRTIGSDYVFPILDNRKLGIHRQYETGLKRQNRSLKVLARMAGIAGSLSTHAARHTWATLAKRLNIPVAVIGEALGHRDVKTTSIYLGSFDRATLDELSVKLSDAVEAA